MREFLAQNISFLHCSKSFEISTICIFYGTLSSGLSSSCSSTVLLGPEEVWYSGLYPALPQSCDKI